MDSKRTRSRASTSHCSTLVSVLLRSSAFSIRPSPSPPSWPVGIVVNYREMNSLTGVWDCVPRQCARESWRRRERRLAM